MTEITVSGFAGSTYVRTVRMLLMEKGVANVDLRLSDDQRGSELLTRRASGIMPIVLIDDFCIKEITAVVRYLDTVLPGKKLVPADPKDAARMDTVLAFSDSFLYRPMVIGVPARYCPSQLSRRQERGLVQQKPHLLEDIFKTFGKKNQRRLSLARR